MRVTLSAMPLAFVACSDAAQDAVSAVAVRDSAGIQFVESKRPQWADGGGWLLSQDPIIEIGLEDGDPMVLLAEVRGAALLTNWQLVVANGGDNTVRVYNRSGGFVRSMGGTGRGPGQFRGLSHLSTRDGTILGAAGRTLHVFAEDGTLLRSHTITATAGEIVGIFDDGTLVLKRSNWQGPRSSGWNEEATYLTLRFGADKADTVATRPDMAYALINNANPSLVLFGPMAQVSVACNAIYHGWPERFDLEELDSNGRSVRRIRRLHMPDAVRSADRLALIDALVTEAESSAETPPAEVLRRALAEVPAADAYPAHATILADELGFLWVQRYTVDGYISSMVAGAFRPPADPVDWDVFDAAGIWLGPVRLPGAFMPMQIRDDIVVGVHYDPIGVERVRVYTLTRTARPS